MVSFLVISVGVNLFYLQRKLKRSEKWREEMKLVVYKKISFERGYDYFLNEIKKAYPETNIANKYIIVYRWDSLHYNSVYKGQLRALDSMAANFGKFKLEYVLVTEMQEDASRSFLKRNQGDFNNLKMLFGMDDFISGLHNINGIKLIKPVINNISHRKIIDSSLFLHKQVIFYSIMDSKKNVFYTNEDKMWIVKDTAFLNRLKTLIPDQNLKILN